MAGTLVKRSKCKIFKCKLKKIWVCKHHGTAIIGIGTSIPIAYSDYADQVRRYNTPIVYSKLGVRNE